MKKPVMKERRLDRRTVLGMGLAALCAWSTSAFANTTPASSQLVPEYQRVELGNGLTLLLLEHHELPLVDFQFVFRTGSITDPPGQEGLADLTMSLLRKGTRKYTAEQIAEELDFLGARMDLGASYEMCTLNAQFLAKDVDAGLQLIANLLLHPTFPEDEVRKRIDLNVDSIVEDKDNPRRVIGTYFSSFLFRGHAFGRSVGGTEESLRAISRGDILRFHTSFLRPNNAILAVAGDFDSQSMRALIQSALGSWESRSVTRGNVTPPKPAAGQQVLVVDKPGSAQTYFRIGNLGTRKGNDDTAVLDVVNTVFGGRFTSWLTNEMRTKAGLTYNAHSRFIERSVPGPFYISSFTQTETTEKTIDLALELLERLHQKGLSQEELDSAKNYIRGQFPPGYETAGELAHAIAELEFYGLDRGYVNDHTRKTDAVTVEQARAAIEKYYPRKDWVLVMIGEAGDIASVATKYGVVRQKKVSDPGF